VVGQRTQESANLLLDRVAYVTDDHIPFRGCPSECGKHKM